MDVANTRGDSRQIWLIHQSSYRVRRPQNDSLARTKTSSDKHSNSTSSRSLGCRQLSNGRMAFKLTSRLYEPSYIFILRDRQQVASLSIFQSVWHVTSVFANILALANISRLVDICPESFIVSSISITIANSYLEYHKSGSIVWQNYGKPVLVCTQEARESIIFDRRKVWTLELPSAPGAPLIRPESKCLLAREGV